MSNRARDLAKGRWHELLPRFGVDPSFLRNRAGPCPMCGGKDRWRYDDKGLGLYYCQQCGAGDGFSLIMGVAGMPFAEAARAVERELGQDPVEPARKPVKKDPRPRLRRIAQSMSRDVAHTETERYLQSRRLSPAPATRHIAQIPYFDAGQRVCETAAMAHLVHSPDGVAATVHLTYLDGDGKADVEHQKKLMPACVPWVGGAVRLYPLAGPVMGIAEGVETAIACHLMDQFPVWAAINADNLAEFVPPEGIESVIIYGDNDASYTGQAVSYALARKLAIKGFDVSVKIPDKQEDWADVWTAGYRSVNAA